MATPNDLFAAADPNLNYGGFSRGTGCYDCYNSNDWKPADSKLMHNPGCRLNKIVCDWQTTIEEDRKLSGGRRLIVANSNHLTGSGAWDGVVVFGCVAGQVKVVFADEFLYFADIEHASKDKLVFSVGDWQAADPTCCPSKTKQMVYRWNAQLERYVADPK